MGNSSYVQTNFLGGEWSKVAQGRADKPEYKTALAVARNLIPIPPGAAPRRPGFRHVAITRNGAPARLIDYTFQEATPYNMELTDGFLRFFTGPEPVRTNDDVAVVSISSATPAVVTVLTAVDWASGDRVRFLDLDVNNPLLQNREFNATMTATTTFTLTDAITGDEIDGSTLGTFVSGTVGRIAELATPYAEARLSVIRKAQINRDFDTDIVLFEANTRPQIVSVEEEPTEDAFAEFAIAPANLEDGPYLDHTKNAQVTPSGTTGLISLTFDFKAYSSSTAYSTGDYVTDSSITYRSLTDENQNHTPASSPTYWEVADATEAINSGRGLLETDVGRHVRIYSEPPIWAVGTAYVTGDVRSYKDVVYTALQNGTGKTPDAFPAYWSITPSGAIWSWGKITSVSGSVSTPIANSLGTYIGGFSNKDAAFNGVTAVGRGSCANSGSANDYIGLNFSGNPQSIASAIVYGPTGDDIGAFYSGTITLNLRVKQTAPASRSDGSILSTTSFTDVNNAVKTLISTDQITEWNYAWIEVVTGGASGLYIAEIIFNSLVATGGTGCSIQVLGDPLLYITAARAWRLGLYSDTTGWPRCGVGHEGRLWLSGGAKNRIDASRSNKPYNFAPTETDGAVTGSNAFSYTFNAKDANTIFWLESEPKGVLCGTEAGEWLLQSTTQSNPLTPTTVQANKSTRIGCANAEPAKCENTLVIIQGLRRRLVEYFGDVNAGKFTAPNLSEFSAHMLKDRAMEVVYQRELVPIVWVRDGEGALKGMTYKRESLISSNPPEFYGWHRHDLGSEREIESMVVGPSIDKTTDTLAVITNDPLTDIRHVEMLTTIQPEGVDILEAWFLDNAVAASSYTVDSVAKTVTLNGLWHLNDKLVTVFAGGLDLGDYTVEDGSIELTIGIVAGFTLPYVMSFGGEMPTVVGFTYTSQGQQLRPISMADTGAQAGPGFAKNRRNHQFGVLLESTKGISFGTDLAKVKTAKLTTKGGTPLTALELKSGIHTEPMDDDSGYDGMICWQITRPYPATVVMLGGFIATQDK